MKSPQPWKLAGPHVRLLTSSNPHSRPGQNARLSIIHSVSRFARDVGTLGGEITVELRNGGRKEWPHVEKQLQYLFFTWESNIAL